MPGLPEAPLLPGASHPPIARDPETHCLPLPLPQPVARVRMARRVPHGFHCLWVSEEELQAQQAAAMGV